MKKLTKILSLVLLVVMCLTVLTACAPNSDPYQAEAALKKNGYTVIMLNGTAAEVATALKGIENVDATVDASARIENSDGEKILERVVIYYFENADAAKVALDKIRSEYEKAKGDSKDWVFGQSGSMIYYGTKAGVKAAR